MQDCDMPLCKIRSRYFFQSLCVWHEKSHSFMLLRDVHTTCCADILKLVSSFGQEAQSSVWATKA